VLVVALLCPAIAFGQQQPPEQRRIDQAIDRGLAFLAQQQRADGSFQREGPRVATSALAVMSFLAAGHTADVGKYGVTVRKGVSFLLSQVPADGYVGRVDGGRMYGHGIVTLALAEAAGVEPDPDVRRQIVAALATMTRVILQAQAVPKPPEAAGGWRYEPQSSDSDLSLSGWCMLALRAASSAGVEVPPASIEKARDYVLRCYSADRGGFSYVGGVDPTVGMNGVAVLNLALTGALDAPQTRAGAEFLRTHKIDANTRFPFYTAYYAVQAANQAGGPVWDAVWPATASMLINQQDRDGGWPQSRTGEEPGRVYSTAMSVLTLTVPYQLLPTYQR
jgi:hypothetical protein